MGSWYLLELWGLTEGRGKSISAGLAANVPVRKHSPWCTGGASQDTQGREARWLTSRTGGTDVVYRVTKQHVQSSTHNAPVDTAFVLHSISGRVGSTQRNHAEPWTFPAGDSCPRVLVSTQLPKSTAGEGMSITSLFASHLWVTLWGRTLARVPSSEAPKIPPWYVRRDVVYSLKPDCLHVGSGENILQLSAEGVGKSTWTDRGVK